MKAFPSAKVLINETKPRSKSFELSVIKEGGEGKYKIQCMNFSPFHHHVVSVIDKKPLCKAQTVPVKFLWFELFFNLLENVKPVQFLFSFVSDYDDDEPETTEKKLN